MAHALVGLWAEKRTPGHDRGTPERGAVLKRRPEAKMRWWYAEIRGPANNNLSLPSLASCPIGQGPARASKAVQRRAETAATLRMFRDAFARRRCLVPHDAFYEWQAREGAPKQHSAIGRAAGEPLALAGIWEGWRSLEDGVLRSFAIMVTEPNAEMALIHHRMPVIIEPADWPAWLGECRPAIKQRCSGRRRPAGSVSDP